LAIAAMLAAALAFWTGCASRSGPSNVMEGTSGHVEINDRMLEWEISIQEEKHKRVNGLLHAAVSIRNNGSELRELEYRFRWFDAEGYELEATPWLPVSVNPKETRMLQATAHTPEAADYRCYVRMKRSEP
jgi:uncharacterized protein YcfL